MRTKNHSGNRVQDAYYPKSLSVDTKLYILLHEARWNNGIGESYSYSRRVHNIHFRANSLVPSMYTKKGQIGTYIAFGGNQCSRRENKFNSAWREDGLPRVVLSEDIYHCCYGCNRCGAFTTSMVTRFVIT